MLKRWGAPLLYTLAQTETETGRVTYIVFMKKLGVSFCIRAETGGTLCSFQATAGKFQLANAGCVCKPGPSPLAKVPKLAANNKKMPSVTKRRLSEQSSWSGRQRDDRGPACTNTGRMGTDAMNSRRWVGYGFGG